MDYILFTLRYMRVGKDQDVEYRSAMIYIQNKMQSGRQDGL